jgi:hypothetical protein
MASLAYIKFNSKGFWIPEAFIEVLSESICEVFEAQDLSTFSTNLQRLYKYCDANRSGASMGMVGIPFDRTVTNNADKIILINALNQTKSLIASKGQTLSTTILNAFENRKVDDDFKSYWGYPIQTHSLTATIDITIQMLNGVWTSSNYSVYYTGFPNPTGQPEI